MTTRERLVKRITEISNIIAISSREKKMVEYLEETFKNTTYNIEIDNINNLIRIELCGQGLWDYESLDFCYNDGKIKSINLYTTEKNYYIYEYLYSNTFNYDDMFKISIFISLITIGVTICVKIKRKNNKKEKRYK